MNAEKLVADPRTLDDLKEAGANSPAPDDVVALYRQAFEEFGARALWSSRPAANPTAADALAITRSLRVEGDLKARRLAERIEGRAVPLSKEPRETRAMRDSRSLEELKDLGSGKPAPGDVARLYGEAFAEHRARALWNWKQLERPTITQALAIAESLRTEGDRRARALALRIEAACRAAL